MKILENELLRSREDLRKANDRNSDLLTHFGKQVPLVHIFSWFFSRYGFSANFQNVSPDISMKYCDTNIAKGTKCPKYFKTCCFCDVQGGLTKAYTVVVSEYPVVGPTNPSKLLRSQ